LGRACAAVGRARAATGPLRMAQGLGTAVRAAGICRHGGSRGGPKPRASRAMALVMAQVF
jgi:hypothetical protein